MTRQRYQLHGVPAGSGLPAVRRERIRHLLVFGSVLLLVGLASTLAAAWAQEESSSPSLAYAGVAFTLAGFIFAAGGWVSSVRGVNARCMAHHRTLHGDDECGGLVADVRTLQVQARSFVTNADILARQQELAASLEQRCAAHAKGWREELERERCESEKRWEEQSKRIDSALAAMQTLVRAVGHSGLGSDR